MPLQPSDGENSPLLPFKYQSLETPRSFRLLQLSRTFSWTGLSCFTGSLQNYGLDTCPPFTALSYVWGDPTNTVAFECDGKPLRITKNCYDALQRLMRWRWTRLVWVDAICIDQNNLPEKGVQVALMCDVYTTANHVMIWLGPGSSAADEGMQRLRTCATVHRLATCQGPLRKQRMRAYMNYIERGLDNQPGRYGSLPAGTIGEVLSNEWFERLWVLQEAALPHANRVALYCGKRRVGLDSVMQFASFATGRDCKIDPWTFTRATSHCAALAMIDNVKIGDRGPDNLFRLLGIASSKYTSYPGDYVYAINGIATRNGLSPPMPDYSKSISEVFKETARHCIEAEQKLTILAMAGSASALNLPSWVPDFSLPAWHTSTGDYRATQMSKNLYSFDTSGLQLTVQGILLDTTKECGPSVPMIKGLVSPRFYSMRNDITRALQAAVPAWIKMAKTSYNQGTRTDETLTHLQWTMALEEPLGEDDEPLMFDLDALEYYFDPEQDYSADQLGERDFMLSMLPIYWVGRRFFLTESGRMGMGPDRSEPGDHIALISGLRLPFMVRKQGPHFKLLGWAFVYGIMHGQAWSDEPNLRDITFV